MKSAKFVDIYKKHKEFHNSVQDKIYELEEEQEEQEKEEEEFSKIEKQFIAENAKYTVGMFFVKENGTKDTITKIHIHYTKKGNPIIMYYFTQHDCLSEKILQKEIKTGKLLLPNKGIWAIPSTVKFHEVKKVKYDEKTAYLGITKRGRAILFSFRGSVISDDAIEMIEGIRASKYYYGQYEFQGYGFNGIVRIIKSCFSAEDIFTELL